MNSRFLIMLIIAAILAGGAALIAKRWVESQTGNNPVNAEQNNVQVYVAATDIPYGSHIKDTQIKLMALPKDSLPLQAFTQEDTQKDPKAIVDKVAQITIYANQILLKPQIKESLGALQIQEGKRAISVRVDDVAGVAGFILPNNNADILVTGSGSKIKCEPKEPGYKVIPIAANSQNETYTLLYNIKILAIDQLASQDQDKPAVVRALTLEVDPRQAECLVQAMRTGALQFTLRNATDTSAAEEIPEAPPVNPPSQIKAAKPYKAPISLKILPWGSQKFIECESGTC